MRKHIEAVWAGGQPPALPGPDDARFVTPVGLNVQLDLDRAFADRYEFATYVVDSIGPEWNSRLPSDYAFWNWLALAYIEQFRQSPSKFSRLEHYVVDEGPDRVTSGRPLAYRHCARTPVLLVKQLGPDARFFLRGTVEKPGTMRTMGDQVEQIVSSPKVMRSLACLELIYSLYKDPASGRALTGSMSEIARERKRNGKWSKRGYGGARRLVRVLPRVKLTYNVELLKPDAALGVVGTEFQSWKERHRNEASSS
jgi:hypothetical protein